MSLILAVVEWHWGKQTAIMKVLKDEIKDLSRGHESMSAEQESLKLAKIQITGPKGNEGRKRQR